MISSRLYLSTKKFVSPLFPVDIFSFLYSVAFRQTCYLPFYLFPLFSNVPTLTTSSRRRDLSPQDLYPSKKPQKRGCYLAAPVHALPSEPPKLHPLDDHPGGVVVSLHHPSRLSSRSFDLTFLIPSRAHRILPVYHPGFNQVRRHLFFVLSLILPILRTGFPPSFSVSISPFSVIALPFPRRTPSVLPPRLVYPTCITRSIYLSVLFALNNYLCLDLPHVSRFPKKPFRRLKSVSQLSRTLYLGCLRASAFARPRLCLEKVPRGPSIPFYSSSFVFFFVSILHARFSCVCVSLLLPASRPGPTRPSFPLSLVSFPFRSFSHDRCTPRSTSLSLYFINPDSSFRQNSWERPFLHICLSFPTLPPFSFFVSGLEFFFFPFLFCLLWILVGSGKI